ncbi:5-oxoprolinase subunit PxpB [Pantoea ananatis]|uniref:5-oxoprolinase subunit PxpB n=1 Tax=Pantoea ananas TaxID=553 RepID=UPI002079449A|nr:5-oxoprolinase subunit PxpB [Pantoea ananatis]MCW0352861.1 5-oxoprolinase subunit B [Pantoea ananatis]USL57132.1 5-oxoprolinase subunit PxpB [Pantoea ananatis]
MQETRCYMLGERAVVLELAPPVSLTSQQRIWQLSERLQSHGAIRDVIPGMNNLTLLLEEAPSDAQQATAQLQQWWLESEAQTTGSRLVNVPVIYGGEAGPDLLQVADHAGLSAKQVVELHSSREYDVFFIGFQPGFPYLAGLDPRLHMPRRAEPRVAVPAGSVGIGGSQTGVYPLASPGGWQLIGQTPVALFTPQQQPPTLLQPGDKVRFVPHKEGIC